MFTGARSNHFASLVSLMTISALQPPILEASDLWVAARVNLVGKAVGARLGTFGDSTLRYGFGPVTTRSGK